VKWPDRARWQRIRMAATYGAVFTFVIGAAALAQQRANQEAAR
jgi:hypothetical protein